jgi:cytochrome P450
MSIPAPALPQAPDGTAHNAPTPDATAGPRNAPRILSTPGSPYPQGPSLFARLLAGDLFRLNPLPFLTSSARTYGDLVHLKAAGRHVFQANHPDLIQELLLTDARHHHRGIVMQKAQLVLGQGLLSSEDPHHMRQRRLAQPAFHRDRIAAYGTVIGTYTRELTSSWKPGNIRDLHDDMQLLSLRIVGKTMFNSEMASINARIAAAIDAFMGFLPLAFLPASELLYKLPLPLMNRIRASRRDLDELIYGLIAERRRDDRDYGDLLSMLLASQDAEGTGSMSDEQVRDECVTALLAGNETTANGLSFALWLLARHPEAQERLQQEATEVLGSGANRRDATAADYSRLPWAHACFAEAMRLYPPVWTIARTAAETYQWRGFTVPRGSILLAPTWVLHRDPRFWPLPEAFLPERFLDSAPPASPAPNTCASAPGTSDNTEPLNNKATRPKFAYFPFAAGSRQCIGEGLAWMEGVLILASIARDWSLTPALTAAQMKASSASQGNIPRLDPKVTLRPKDGVLVQLQPR